MLNKYDTIRLMNCKAPLYVVAMPIAEKRSATKSFKAKTKGCYLRFTESWQEARRVAKKHHTRFERVCHE